MEDPSEEPPTIPDTPMSNLARINTAFHDCCLPLLLSINHPCMILCDFPSRISDPQPTDMCNSGRSTTREANLQPRKASCYGSSHGGKLVRWANLPVKGHLGSPLMPAQHLSRIPCGVIPDLSPLQRSLQCCVLPRSVRWSQADFTQSEDYLLELVCKSRCKTRTQEDFGALVDADSIYYLWGKVQSRCTLQKPILADWDARVSYPKASRFPRAGSGPYDSKGEHWAWTCSTCQKGRRLASDSSRSGVGRK